MQKLSKLSSLPADAVELLEAVGYLDTEDLRDADTDELIAELLKANKVLDIMSEDPTEESLEEWRKIARDHEQDKRKGKPDNAPAKGKGKTTAKDKGKHKAKDKGKAKKTTARLHNFEEESDILEMLAVSPEAEPLDPELLHRHDLTLDDIPDGMLLNNCEGNVKINVMTTVELAESQQQKDEAKRAGLNVSRIRNFEDLESDDYYVKPLDRGKPSDAVSVSDRLNAGVKPGSRRFIRGVLHPDPVSIYVAAISVVLLAVVLLLYLVGIPGVLLMESYMAKESVIGLLIGLSSVVVLTFFYYLFLGFRARCRVCGQRQFIPKNCLKHKKAHHARGFGYILPTALHALCYKWFYCTYCGTAVRLKK